MISGDSFETIVLVFLILRKSMPMTMVSVTPAKPYLQVLNLFPNEYDNS